MARAKRKDKPQSASAGMGPTRERMERGDFREIDAPRMAGERWDGAQGKALVTVSPVRRWHADKWIDDAQFVALHQYEALIEAAGYHRSRSCLDMSPKGNGDGMPPKVITARDRLASIRFAIRFDVDTRSLEYVDAVLQPFGAEQEADVIERMHPNMGRDRRRDMRAGYIVDVATALIAITA